MRELLVDSCGTEEEDSSDYEYYILIDQMEVSGGFACESYGVKVVCRRDGDLEEIPNITTSISRIDELMDLLVRNLVTPVTLRDVVEDWL